MKTIKLRKKAGSSLLREAGIVAMSLIIAMLVGYVILWIEGFDPSDIYVRMFRGGFGSITALGRTITRTIPLLLMGVGLALAFKAKAWNIGCPGQMIMGAIAGAGVALFIPFNLPKPLHITLIFIVAFIAGAGFSAICAYLKYKIGLNMVISTLMLNYVALNFQRYLLFGPWQAPGIGFPATSSFPETARLPTLFGTSIHYPTLILGIFASVLLYVLINRTRQGYEIRVFGENPMAAEYAGISKFKILMLVMIISGGLAGLAGAGEITGIHHMLREGVDGAGAVYATSFGYIAIIVAWLGKNTIIGSSIAAFFIGGLLIGGIRIQLVGVPYALVSMLLGLILLGLVGGAFLSRYNILIGEESK